MRLARRSLDPAARLASRLEAPGTRREGAILPARTGRRSRGQSLVEFSLVLTPLMLMLLGVMQFGFIFNGYITMTNAVREAARAGVIYSYDRTLSKDQNDTARNNAARTALLASFNGLTPAAPTFTSSTTWTQSSLTWTTGDLVDTVVIPTGINDSDARVGQRLTVKATYHLTLFIPLVSRLLTTDGNGRLLISTESTMVIQ